MKRNNKYTPALGFDQFTNWYDQIIAWTMPEHEFRTKLVKFAASKAGEKILEFGFGTAENLLYLLEHEREVSYFGLDIDPKIEKIAKEKLQKARFLRQVQLSLYDGDRFPYIDSFFDKVFSCLVFHQLKREEKESALQEIHRVLKPGGKILICDWDKPSGLFTSLGFYAVQMLDGFETTSDSRKGILIDLMKKNGFTNVKHVDLIDTKIGTLKYTIGIK